jgi:hypothetical protein
MKLINSKKLNHNFEYVSFIRMYENEKNNDNLMLFFTNIWYSLSKIFNLNKSHN